MDQVQSKINEYIKTIMQEADGNLLNLVKPAALDLKGSITIPALDQEAYMLQPNTLGYRPIATINRELTDMAIVRIKLGYAKGLEISKSFTATAAWLMPLVQEAVNELASYSSLENKLLTTSRPGVPDKHITELEESAGYEIRLVMLHEPKGV